jgi:multidrug resistance efflux pump
MSNDLVERLRDVFPIGWEGEMRHQAADEIERLRDEIVLLEATGAEASDEIERLRAALRAVEAKANQHRDDAVDDRALEEAARHESVSEIARAALGESRHD